MLLYIKNMVCRHCIEAVKRALKKEKLSFYEIRLGEVQFTKPLDSEQINALQDALKPLGFEVLNDKRTREIDKAKTALINLLASDVPGNFQLSTFLQNKLGKAYSAISKLFS